MSNRFAHIVPLNYALSGCASLGQFLESVIYTFVPIAARFWVFHIAKDFGWGKRRSFAQSNTITMVDDRASPTARSDRINVWDRL